MTKVKHILLAPRYNTDEKVARISATAQLSDYLLDKGFLPIMPFFDTKFKHKEEALDLAQKYLAFSDALILQGGNDICPSLYSQKTALTALESVNFEVVAGNVAKFRDVFELALIEVALQKDLPILGICRGMQIINVYFGGSLHQHLNHEFWQDHVKTDPNILGFDGVILDKIHPVELASNGVLQTWLSKKTVLVNSIHHQGLNQIGAGLSIEATSPDGLVEAISSFKGRVLGLQWHPELDLNDIDQIRILNRWVDFI